MHVLSYWQLGEYHTPSPAVYWGYVSVGLRYSQAVFILVMYYTGHDQVSYDWTWSNQHKPMQRSGFRLTTPMRRIGRVWRVWCVCMCHAKMSLWTHGSRGTLGARHPPRSFQNHAVLRQFKGKTPYFSQILSSESPPLGSKLCWASLTKILDPRLRPSSASSVVDPLGATHMCVARSHSLEIHLGSGHLRILFCHMKSGKHKLQSGQ